MLSMQVFQLTYFSIIIFDYQVVIIKYNHKSHMNMVIYHFYGLAPTNKYHHARE
jgi:hypothetical protein